MLGKPARGKTCEAIQGILAEGEEIMEDYKGTAALDAVLSRPRRLSSTMKLPATAL